MSRAQGTVASYDSDTGAGTVLLDDGVRLAFPAEALDGSRVRHLRPGQRVSLELSGPGTGPSDIRVTAVRIVTLP